MSLLSELAAILGDAHVLTAEADTARYLKDWKGWWSGRARAVLRPATTAEVAAVMRLCHAHGQPVVPQGGNTGLVEAGIPSKDGGEIVLSLERLNAIRAIDPTGFTMVVEAGCILQTVAEAAQAADCFFPLSLGARGSCQIGGNVSTNAGGLNVLRWGMMRDLVLGLEVVLPDGRIWDGLSLLRKDNTGYDLKQLFIGAEGTLGIVTAASLKLFPRPTAVETAMLALPSAEAALTLFAKARRDLCDLLSAYELLTGRESRPDVRDVSGEPQSPVRVGALLCAAGDLGQRRARSPRAAGGLPGIGHGGRARADGALAESEAQRAAFWKIREDLVEAQYRAAPVHLRNDVSVPQVRLAEFIAAADEQMVRAFPDLRPIAYGHVGDGNVHYNVLPRKDLGHEVTAERYEECEVMLLGLAAGMQGSISAEHGIGRTKRHAFLEMTNPVELALMRELKAMFDPKGILSPGRVL